MPASVKSSSSSECGDAAVDDLRRADAALDGGDAGLSFGRMPPSIAVERVAHLRDARLRDQALRVGGVAQPAAHVGQEDQPSRARSATAIAAAASSALTL